MDDTARDLGLVASAVDAALKDPKTPPTARRQICAAQADLHDGMRSWAAFTRRMSGIFAKAKCGDPLYKDAKGGDAN